MPQMVMCPQCGGDGTEQCQYCNGYGSLADGVNCNACAGTGTQTCPLCGGRGWMWDDEI